MPEKRTLKRAQNDKRRGKSTGTQAGEFVREEMHHIKEGKHGARSRAQAIAIGLSKARRSGVKVSGRGKKSRGSGRGSRIHAYKADPKRSRASEKALKRQGRPKLRGAGARASARKGARTRKRNTARR